MPEQPDKIQFRPGDLSQHLAARGDATNAVASQIAARDLDRYYELLALALATVELSQGEASLLVDAMNGTIIDVRVAQLLYVEVEDALEDGLAEKWDVDGKALVAKIRGWNLLQRMAVADAVERYWSGPYRKDRLDAGLVAAGLIRQV